MALDAGSVNANGAAQAVQALFRFLGLFDTSVVEELLQQHTQQRCRKTQHPLRTIQQPLETLHIPAVQANRASAAHKSNVQASRKVGEGMTVEALQSQMQLLYNQYTDKAAPQRMHAAAFLHMLADAQLLSNRFGVLEGHEVFMAAESKEQAGKKQKVAGLSLAGFIDALHRVAAVRFTKISDVEEAYRRLLSHWIIPNTQSGPSDTALTGLFHNLELLEKCDGVLKKVFAWYASLPYLTGQVSWDHFKHTHKGVMPGHILMFLTDFKVVPGLLSVRQVTGVLQQHAAPSKCSDSALQYPQMLEVLCECAVLLRQQIQRKLAGPWVNITELNALKRFLKLQAMPSLQEAYALPNSPKHIATITNGMQKVQLSQTPIAHPTGQAWPQFVPQHSRLAQALPQHSMASHNIHEEDCWASARQPTVQQSVSTMAQAQQQQQQQGLTAHAANASDKTTDCSGMIQKSHVQRQHHSGSTALQAGSIAAHASRPEWSNVTSTGSTKWLWDRHDDMQPEGQRFKEEELAEQAAVQEQACKRHLAGREASKRRLLQHRMERLSSDPRMPARLATHPSSMACSMTPPYALLDPVAAIPQTALNMDGDGWAPHVDLVALEAPSSKQKREGGSSAMQSGGWGELPMRTLRRIPLDTLTATKLGKRSRESARSDDPAAQLAEFDSRLSTLLCSWSIESEREQWTKALAGSQQLRVADAA